MRRMAKMKSATRMALVTGEMNDCMSGAEPGRAAWSSASVRTQSAISLALLLSSPPLRWQLLRMEPGALPCSSTHIYNLTRMHTHSATRIASLPAIRARNAWGLPLLEAAQQWVVFPRIHTPSLPVAHQKTQRQVRLD